MPTHSHTTKPYSATGLPVLPYIYTSVFDGIKYEIHPFTQTCEVVTEDGVSLCDVLNSLQSADEEFVEFIKKVDVTCPWFKYKGILKNLPDLSAIEQLYAKTTPQTGEVWLVEATKYGAVDKIYDLYAWMNDITGWVWLGSTQRKSPIENNDVLKLFPTELGKPGQYLITSPTGTTLMWAYDSSGSQKPTSIDQHNQDPDAHPAIQAKLDLKANEIKIFNAVLRKIDWTFSGDNPFFTYIFDDERLNKGCYFEIIPVINSEETLRVAQEAYFLPSMAIVDTDSTTYGIIHAQRVPKADIEVTVKVYDKYQDLTQ